MICSLTGFQTGITSRLSLLQATAVQNLIKSRYVLCTLCSSHIMSMLIKLKMKMYDRLKVSLSP